ncbi:Hpt domain-containing protein [Parvularcula dongshanensis]|uniref:HPt (Histidine-containing phosphotransfer) domain-containing protein n=1 Tax=Parvularcula dongshanensis TaxID=1173995 RepID=A0A840I013_9PROT|nr:Hpt domain-containing protein [Parvularcula dongshanensis]MBB4657552.1 HPt (histidine-containing phosphotransfer) domain-containing protein [Parvularcula dongshanensis]
MTQNVIEAEQLTVLAHAAGKEAVEPILDAFWQSNDELADQLSNALSSQDIDAIAKAAHALKGSASNLGAVRMAETAREIEYAGKASDLPAVRSAYDRLFGDIEVTKAAFVQLMASI